MCLVVFAWQQLPDYPFVLAANRDERHARPSAALAWWEDTENVLGGRDLEAGGTWLAASRSGRFATVTNFREKTSADAPRSRGEIVSRFVAGTARPAAHAQTLEPGAFAGFSALFKAGDELVYASNRDDPCRALQPGVYGLSNAALDTPWPKLVRTRAALGATVAAGAPSIDDLFTIVADRERPDAADLASETLPFAMRRAHSAPFIVDGDYGTRCSTALIYRADGHIEIAERRFDSAGELVGESRVVYIAD